MEEQGFSCRKLLTTVVIATVLNIFSFCAEKLQKLFCTHVSQQDEILIFKLTKYVKEFGFHTEDSAKKLTLLMQH